MNRPRIAAAAGVVTLGLALVVVAAPGTVPVQFRGGRFVVSVIGLLALVQALRVVRARGWEPLAEAAMPDAERPAAVPSPGESVEEVLATFRDDRRVYYRRSHVREGLQAAAMAVLVEYTGDDEATARQRLATGRWTDDPHAAAFLAGDAPPVSSLAARVRGRLGGESAFERGVHRTVDAIAAIAGRESESTGETWLGRRRDLDRTRAGDGTDRPRADGEGQESGEGIDAETGRGDGTTDDGGVSARRETGHWRGVSVVALAALGAGILATQPAVVLAGVIGIGFVAYARSSAFPPGEPSVTIERRVSTARPDPGDPVTVTVTVANATDRVLPDVRVVDGVPDALAVADGSPRLGTALRPGETDTFEYTLTARRGVHAFGPAVVATRDLPGAVEHESRAAAAATTLRCVPPLEAATTSIPLRRDATRQVGRVSTDTGGEGVEFYATREYRPSDPLARIDWHRRARTGELATVEFREERAARVVLLIDARRTAYVAPGPAGPHAVDRAVEGAGRVYAGLTGAGNRVGVAAVGAADCWLAPGAGREHAARARDVFGTHPAIAPVPDEPGASIEGWAGHRWERRFRRRLAAGTQVILFSPLVDEAGAGLARRLEAYGYPVTVVSPDPTTDRTTGDRLAGIARRLRASRLRGAGIPVIDWAHEEPIDAAVGRHGERGSG